MTSSDVEEQAQLCTSIAPQYDNLQQSRIYADTINGVAGHDFVKTHSVRLFSLIGE